MGSRVFVWLLFCAVTTSISNLLIRSAMISIGGLQFNFATAVILLHSFQFMIGLFLYATAAIIWFYVIALAPIVISYPSLIGLTFLFVTLGGWWIFHEKLTTLSILGILMILAGIVTIMVAHD